MTIGQGKWSLPAQAEQVRFEAGRYFVKWRLCPQNIVLSGYSAMPVALGLHDITINPDGLFWFNEKGDTRP